MTGTIISTSKLILGLPRHFSLVIPKVQGNSQLNTLFTTPNHRRSPRRRTSPSQAQYLANRSSLKIPLSGSTSIIDDLSHLLLGRLLSSNESHALSQDSNSHAQLMIQRDPLCSRYSTPDDRPRLSDQSKRDAPTSTSPDPTAKCPHFRNSTADKSDDRRYQQNRRDAPISAIQTVESPHFRTQLPPLIR
jgi:hypothetical protein